MNHNPLDTLEILLVDNDPRLLPIIKTVVQRLGFRNVATASDGKAAIASLHKRKFDLLITDWQMEGMNGLELVHYIRNDPHSPNCFLPIIMLTGRAEQQNILKARDTGITEFLAKPFRVEDLRKRIIAIVKEPREFVFAEKYAGPTRRRRRVDPPNGIERRSDD